MRAYLASHLLQHLWNQFGTYQAQRDELSRILPLLPNYLIPSLLLFVAYGPHQCCPWRVADESTDTPVIVDMPPMA